IRMDQIPNTITMLRVHAAFKWEAANPRIDNPYDLLGKPRIANKSTGGIVDMGAIESQKQSQTITVADASKTYGDAAFAPAATAGSGLAVTYSSGNTAIAEPFFDAADGKYKLSIKSAGTVTITANQGGDGSWEPASAKTFQLMVAPKPVTIGIKSTAEITKRYDGHVQGGFNSANLEFASGDIINNDDVQAKFNGILVYDNENAGDNKTITLNRLYLELEGAKAGNYVIGNAADITFSSASITKASLTATPVSGQGKIYGDTDPVLAYSISGTLFNSDAITGVLAREAGEDAGDYDITLGSLTAGANYNIILNDELFTIAKKPVIVNFKTTASLSKIYDGSDKANLQSTDLGFAAGVIINADAIGILLSADAAAYDSRHAGDHKTLSVPYSGLSLTGAKAGNYQISNTAVLSTNEASITPAPLSITAEGKTKVYGTADPILTYSISGGQLFGSDQLTGALGRDPGSDVGVYPITLNTLSGGSDYAITYVGANLSITKASQNISWAQNDFEIGCNGAPVPITLMATSNSGLTVTYVVTNPAIASVNGNILTPVAGGATTITAIQAGDNNHEPAMMVTKNLKYQMAGAIRQHWADAIFFDNTGGNYTAWQWYKNGNPVNGATSPYYSESTALNGNFYVVATDKNGNVVESCPVTAAGAGFTAGIKVSPNPVRAGSAATVTCNYSTGELTGAKLILSLITGTKVQEVTQVNAANQVTMPAQGGLYVLTLILSNGQKASVNVLVK
ncbi:MAG: MBG domain-containing protein, partial [Pseudobacter sp.]|uniref:MBG domain-containing protein n=1 Tax=Pseudobacter sp. TaxID=2045420 RepID=UPI003F7FBB36